MNFILNIGLKSETLGDITVAQALDAINAAGFFVYRPAVYESDTEPTLVAEIKSDYSYTPMAVRLEQIASALGQDCIAVYHPVVARGRLWGPKPWGEFDGRFFLQLDGTRLVKEAVPA